jgi:ABC-2 type transport system ATP-binding protein
MSPPAPPYAIQLTEASKHYGALPALSDVSLAVSPGEVMGFLGPNGAGKTTTIRLLLGFLRPTSGRVHLLGEDMADRRAAMRARAQLGFAPDVAGLDPAASGQWLLDDLARLQGCPPVDRAALIEALELRPADLRRPLGRLSRGTRQKINLVQAMQGRPSLLILDEPTEGLDPLAKAALFSLLRAAHRRGATIFFSSHVLGEVEALCDSVALIRGGRLAAVDRIDELRRHMQRCVRVRVSGDPAAVERQLAALPGVSGLSAASETGDAPRVEAGGAASTWQFLAGDLPPLLGLLAALPVIDVAIEPPSLEDVFLQYYRPGGPHA